MCKLPSIRCGQNVRLCNAVTHMVHVQEVNANKIIKNVYWIPIQNPITFWNQSYWSPI